MSGAAESKANPIDQHVGWRIRQRRRSLGLSQTALANQLGLTFQQVQKYERGFNRVSASKLYEIAKILSVPLADFFEGLPPTTGETGEGQALEHQPRLKGLMDTRDGEMVAEYFPKIECLSLRRAVALLVRATVRAQ